MSAYLVAYLASSKEGNAKLLGLDVFSEPSPSHEGGRRTALILEWPGETYAIARDSLLGHLAKTAPWLLPSRNGGREK